MNIITANRIIVSSNTHAELQPVSGGAYLDPGLWQVDFVGKAFPGKHVGVVSPFKLWNKTQCVIIRVVLCVVHGHHHSPLDECEDMDMIICSIGSNECCCSDSIHHVQAAGNRLK